MSSLVPEGWRIETISNLASKVGSGITPKGGSTVYSLYGIKFLRSQNIHFSGISLRDIAYISPDIHASMSGSKVQEGDVLLNITGASIGRCSFVPSGFGEANVNQHVCIIRPNQKVTTQYLTQWLSSDFGQHSIGIYQAGGNREGLNFQQIRSIPVNLPPLPQQQKIAAILSSVDNVIEKTRAQIDKLKDVKTGMMQALLTKGIGHTEFKDSPVGRIPKSWALTTLGATATLQRGHDLTQANTVSGSYPVISSSGVNGMHNEFTTRGPGVLVGRKGSIGRVHYIESDFWAHDTSLYVTNFHGNDVQYIYQLFSWLDLQKYGTKSGSPSLNRNDLHPLKIAMPPLAEQKKIRQVLMHIDERLCDVRKKLSHVKGLKKALMQDLLTGKVRVKIEKEALLYAEQA